ncbi:hypothetical protein ACLK12_20155 [Escherichia coli]
MPSCSAGAKRPANLPFENAPAFAGKIAEQEYFDNGVVMVAMVKAGVELAFEPMVTPVSTRSLPTESLHELPLIADTVARKRLQMNVVISDTSRVR